MALAIFACIVAVVTAIRTLVVRSGRNARFASLLAVAVPLVPALLYSGLLLLQLLAASDPSAGGAGIVIPAILGAAIAAAIFGVALSKAIQGNR